MSDPPATRYPPVNPGATTGQPGSESSTDPPEDNFAKDNQGYPSDDAQPKNNTQPGIERDESDGPGVEDDQAMMNITVVMRLNGEKHDLSLARESTTVGDLKDKIRQEILVEVNKPTTPRTYMHLYWSSVAMPDQEFDDDALLLKDHDWFQKDVYRYKQKRLTTTIYLVVDVEISVAVVGMPGSNDEPTAAAPGIPPSGSIFTIAAPKRPLVDISFIKQQIKKKCISFYRKANENSHIDLDADGTAPLLWEGRIHLLWDKEAIEHDDQILQWKDIEKHRDQEHPAFLCVWFDAWAIHIHTLVNISTNQEHFVVFASPAESLTQLKLKVHQKRNDLAIEDMLLVFEEDKLDGHDQLDLQTVGLKDRSILYLILRQDNVLHYSPSASPPHQSRLFRLPRHSDRYPTLRQHCNVQYSPPASPQPLSRLVCRPRHSVCRIRKPERRGITLLQLREIASTIILRCQSEGWRSTNPEFSEGGKGKLLAPEDVTLYDLMHHYIHPITERYNCSYVEFISISKSEQIPHVFCSHWWGESVLEFVASLEQHAYDRNFSETTCYWICAYALNQHDLSGELQQGANHDPRHTPFYRALQTCKGAVMILDRNLICYSRIWCVFETAIVMNDIKGGGDVNVDSDEETFFYDLYTFQSNGYGKAVGLTDGPVAVDRYKMDEEGKLDLLLPRDDNAVSRAVSERHSRFPLRMCRKALNLQLEKGESTMPEDKTKILNSIVGNSDDFSAAAPNSHPEFDKLNTILRAKFAESAYRLALEDGNVNMEDFRLALSRAQYKKLSMSFNGCSQFQDEAKLFIQSLPSTLVYLDLNIGKINFKTSGEFAVGLERIQNLEHLILHLDRCNNLSSVDPLLLALRKLDHLKKLQLNLQQSYQVSPSWVLAKACSFLPRLSLLKLNFDGCLGESSTCVTELRTLLESSRFTLSQLVVFHVSLADTNINSDELLGTAVGYMSSLEELVLNLRTKNLLSLNPIAKALSNSKWLKLLELRCSNNPIQTIDTLVTGLSMSESLNGLSALRLDFGQNHHFESINGLGSAIMEMPFLVELELVFLGNLRDTNEELLVPFESAAFSCLERLHLEVGYRKYCRGINFIKGSAMPQLRSLTLGLINYYVREGLLVDRVGETMDAFTSRTSLRSLANGFAAMTRGRKFDRLHLNFPYEKEAEVLRVCGKILDKEFQVKQLRVTIRNPFGGVNNMNSVEDLIRWKDNSGKLP